MKEKKPRAKNLNAPVGEVCKEKMKAIVLYRKLTTAGYNNTDLIREWADKDYEKLPKQFQTVQIVN